MAGGPWAGALGRSPGAVELVDVWRFSIVFSAHPAQDTWLACLAVGWKGAKELSKFFLLLNRELRSYQVCT